MKRLFLFFKSLVSNLYGLDIREFIHIAHWVTIPVVLMVGTALFFYSRSEKKSALTEVHERLLTQVLTQAADTKKSMDSLVSAVETIGTLISTPDAVIADYMVDFMDRRKMFYLFSIAYDPVFLKSLQAGKYPEYKLENHFSLLKNNEIPDSYCPQIFRTDSEQYSYRNDDMEIYQFRNWYLLPKILGRGVWSDPYTPENMKSPICTYSIPFYYKGMLAGVVCAGFLAESLLDRENGLNLQTAVPGVGMFVLAEDGKILFHTHPKSWSKKSLYYMVSDSRQEKIYPELDKIFSGSAGIINIKDWNNWLNTTSRYHDTWFIYTQIDNGSDWVLAAFCEEEEILADIHWKLLKIWIGGILLMLLLITAIFLLLAWFLTPVLVISNLSQKITDGDLSVRMPENYCRTKSIIGRLGTNFNTMIVSLQSHIEQAVTEQTKLQSMEKELGLSRKIQYAILPQPASISTDSLFLIDSKIVSSQYVTGDLYDYWKVDDKTLAILVVDVATKSFAAALVMVIIRMLMQRVTQSDKTPAEIVSEANQIFMERNEKNMYATMFFCLYHMETGELTWCNAGHNPPALIHADGSLEWLPCSEDIVFGIFPDVKFTDHKTSLAHGDTLFLFTNGLVYAKSEQEESFGTERLAAILSKEVQSQNVFLVDTVVQEFNSFVALPLSDDVVIVSLTRT